jgi:hypothetical protein
MAAPHDVPLVGPGNELQLTIDGRAVPHHEVVAAQAARSAEARPARERDAAAGPPAPASDQAPLLDG